MCYDIRIKTMKAGQKINMKYLIIGAGGTGGVTGYYMKKAGKDVTLIARGEHLKKIQKQGLTLEKMWDKTEENKIGRASCRERV